MTLHGYAAGAAWIFFSAAALLRFAHVLQAERYHTNAYVKWVLEGGGLKTFLRNRHDIGLHLAAFGFLIPLFGQLIRINLAELALAAIGILWAAANIRADKAQKKPLVITARVKRLFSVTLVIEAAIFAIAFPHGEASAVGIIVLLGYAQPFMLALGNIASAPIEKSLQEGFKNQARQKLRGKQVVAITGSYGKTGTKDAVAHLLETKYPLIKTPGSFNTPMGLCKVINDTMEAHHEMFVTEMGATRQGDIRELCELVRPTVGIITSIGVAHMETFGGIDAVARTKFELADALPPDGILIYNADYELARKHAEGRPQKKITYALEQAADYMPVNLRCGREGSVFDIKTPQGMIEGVKIRLLGKLHALNVTAAFAVGRHFGIDPERLKHGASTLAQVEARLQLIQNPGGYLIINDGFNSNPVGAATAAETLGYFAGFKKIMVTPGIVDLGGEHEKVNFAFGNAAAPFCDMALLINERRTKPIADGLAAAGFDENNILHFSSLAAARGWLAQNADEKCVVLFENDLPDHMEKF